MIGQTLGHYKIFDKLGAGGMGEVYRAEDTTLDREVALKILPRELADSRERLARFQREAKILAALDHPNIVTVFTVEQARDIHFLTMQLVEGRPLSHLIPRGGMPLERIFEIAIPLADALATAHEKGVIHRDLKPANVMVTDEARVKVLDFGLAKLRDKREVPVSSHLPTEPLTEEGRIVGTMPYMSPEQLEGKDIDARSDIFSLGVMLYEIATGERPFKGESSASLIMSIGRDTPPDVDSMREELPHHLGRVIRHCLEKDPARRYQSALDVRNELADLRREGTSQVEAQSSAGRAPEAPKTTRWRLLAAALLLSVVGMTVAWLLLRPWPRDLGISAPASEPPKIVVLPFENLGPPEDEYFAEGMTDEVASRLAAVEGLGVISRTSAMQYRDDRPPLSQIVADLGVDYVLEGSVRWERDAGGEGRVGIIPQLIRTADDTQQWSSRYVRVLDDVFAIQGEIAEEVSRELQVVIGEPALQAMRESPTESVEAYHSYLRAMKYRRAPGYSRRGLDRAAQLLTRAVELDPEFVRAWAELAWVHSMIFFSEERTEGRNALAADALARAEQVSPDSPLVRAVAGYYHYWVERDYDRALAEFHAALEGLPGNVDVLSGIGYVHRRLGDLSEALEVLRRALELDPRVGVLANDVADTLYAMRRYDTAMPYADRAVALAPDEPEFWGTKVFNELSRTGDLGLAREALSTAPIQDDPELLYYRVTLDLYARDYEAGLKVLEASSLETIDSFARAELLELAAIAHDRLGEDSAAIERMEASRDALVETLKRQPEDAWLESRLARAYAYLGHGEEALKLGHRAAAAWAEDRFSGPRFLEDLAVIHMDLGNLDQSIDLLDRLLLFEYQNAIGAIQLELDPLWDPLRDHPRFQALLEKYGQEG